MKKLLFIIVLATLQSGCASQSGHPVQGTLLSFEDLASEITVGYEELSDGKASDRDIEGPLGTP